MKTIDVGIIISGIVALIGLVLLSYDTLTGGGAFHKIGVLYALILAIGVMALITTYQLKQEA
ncbi:MAG: hypothetical protein M1129_02065 [Candidatus Thermoplasmatota archaeon]|jgi:hypothetical protein|nr:hypothetical protein [Candidatus Thermoplasmatota archaeon]MCL5955618.1 hypothetical protein [Candidatus Thermoplasmatota archaeon]